MSFEGKYAVEINTPMGKQTGNLVIAQEGNALTGTMEAEGDIAPVANGTVDGETATWSVDVTKPMPLTLTFTATKDGDNLVGKCALGAFGQADFTGAAV